MAQEKKQSKPVVLYSPKGAKVTVSEDAVKGYTSRRYSKTQPKVAPKPDDVAGAMRAQIEAEVRAEIEAEQAKAVEDAAKADPKK